jgi:hypothetical protein
MLDMAPPNRKHAALHRNADVVSGKPAALPAASPKRDTFRLAALSSLSHNAHLLTTLGGFRVAWNSAYVKNVSTRACRIRKQGMGVG